jgi:hypothetical protein
MEAEFDRGLKSGNSGQRNEFFGDEPEKALPFCSATSDSSYY